MISQLNQHRAPYPDIRPAVTKGYACGQWIKNLLSDTLAQSDESGLCVVFGAEPPNVHLRATSLLYPHTRKGGYRCHHKLMPRPKYAASLTTTPAQSVKKRIGVAFFPMDQRPSACLSKREQSKRRLMAVFFIG